MRYLILLQGTPPATPPPPALMEAIMNLGAEATASGGCCGTFASERRLHLFRGPPSGRLHSSRNILLTLTDG